MRRPKSLLMLASLVVGAGVLGWRSESPGKQVSPSVHGGEAPIAEGAPSPSPQLLGTAHAGSGSGEVSPWLPGAPAEAESPPLRGVELCAWNSTAESPTPRQEPEFIPPHLRVEAARVWRNAAGELVVGQESSNWDVPGEARDTLLVSYDLSSLTPERVAGPPPALRGQDSVQDSASMSGWWAGLLERVLASVNAGDWPSESTGLAYDDWTDTLFVQQTPAALSEVERLLALVAQERSSWIPVRVEAAESAGSTRLPVLRLDVPWGRGVRALQGRTWALVGDYDVECGMGMGITPLVVPCDVGFAVSAWRSDRLHVEVSWTDVTPEVTPWAEGFGTTYGRSLLENATLEVVEPSARSWRGELPCVPGVQRVTLPGGPSVLLHVGAEQRFAVPASTSSRTDLTRLTGAPEPRNSRPRGVVRASWSSRGGRGEELVEQPQSPSYGQEFETAPSCFLAPGAAPIPVTDGADARVLLGLEGGVRTCGRVLELEDGSLAVDVEVCWGRPTGAVRRVPVRALLYGKTDPTDSALTLPVSHQAVTSRCVMVPRGRSTSLHFEADLGAGAEVLTLTLTDVTDERAQ